jgi:hypothetical protein
VLSWHNDFRFQRTHPPELHEHSGSRNPLCHRGSRQSLPFLLLSFNLSILTTGQEEVSDKHGDRIPVSLQSGVLPLRL